MTGFFKALTLSASAIVMTNCIAVASVAAASPEKHFDIKAQPLASALRQFSVQAKQPLLFSDEGLSGLHTPGIKGNFPSERVLQVLLKDSNLISSRTADGVILLNRAPARPQGVRRISTAAPAADVVQRPATPPPPPERTEGIEDIVVTAQKRAENLQDTPISMVALNADALTNRGVSSIADLFTGTIPSLRVAPFAGRPASMMIGMRGIVPSAPDQITRDMTVGIYIDGIYLGRAQGLGLELAEIERIEVLRGPQGTLFGRNAVGGAVSIVTKRPTGEFGLDGKVGFGNRNGRSLTTRLNLPQFANISVKLDGVYNGRDGWVKNTLPGADDFHEVKRYGFRAASLWEPASNFSLQYAFDLSRDKSTGGYWHLTERTSPTAAPLAPIFSIDRGRASVTRLGVPLDPSTARVSGHSVTAEWEVFDAFTVKSITGWRKLSQDQWDQDAGLISLYRPGGSVGRFSYSNVSQNQFSQEIQLIGEVGDVKYVAGGYYFDEDATETATVFTSNTWNADGTAAPLRNPPTSGPVPDRAGWVHSKSKALFGQATWSPSGLDGRLHLTGGIRYTDDKKHGGLSALRGVDPGLLFRFRSSRVDPMGTIAYDISDEINAYFKYGQAYRAGGASSRSVTLRTFNEEVLKSWEVGLKSDLLDRRVRLNIAAYVSQLTNTQVDFLNPAFISNTETLNVKDPYKIKGAEIDVTVTPVSGFFITTNYVFTDAKAGEQINPFTNLPEFVQVAYTPKHAVSLAMDYAFPRMSLGQLKAHVDFDWSSGYYSNAVPSSDNTLSNRTILANARLTLADIALGASNLEFSIWGRNLTNREVQLYDTRLTAVGNVGSFFNEPRTYGIEGRIRF